MFIIIYYNINDYKYKLFKKINLYLESVFIKIYLSLYNNLPKSKNLIVYIPYYTYIIFNFKI